MPLINCKVELKLKWTKYCVLSVAGNENDINNNDNANNIIFTIKDLKSYVPVLTLSARDNQKNQFIGTNIKQTVRINNKYRYVLKSNFVRVNRLFLLIYTNHGNNTKRFNARKYYLPKGIIKNYNVIINGKKLL